MTLREALDWAQTISLCSPETDGASSYLELTPEQVLEAGLFPESSLEMETADAGKQEAMSICFHHETADEDGEELKHLVILFDDTEEELSNS
jgi:hypothetical protein